MTRQTFYRNLKKYSKFFRWKMDEYYDNSIRGIRGMKRYCPITAVCYMKKGKYFATHFYREAAKEIGLKDEDIDVIAASADNRSHKTENKSCRKSLERAVGL